MRARRLNGKIVLLAVVGLALAVGVGRLAVPHCTSPSDAATTGANTTAPIPPTSAATPSGSSPRHGLLDGLGDDVETLGEDDYADTFAGLVETPGGRLVIYTTTPNDPTFRRAVAEFNTEHLPVRFVRARFSLNQLNALEDGLSNHWRQLKLDGVNWVAGWPAPPYDAIYVTLQRPTNQDLRRLSTSGLVPADLTPVTRSNYIAAAGAAVSSAVGPNYRILPKYGQPMTPV